MVKHRFSLTRRTNVATCKKSTEHQQKSHNTGRCDERLQRGSLQLKLTAKEMRSDIHWSKLERHDESETSFRHIISSARWWREIRP